ncbi:serine hydrolase [Devosia sp. XJ19-1]|uniref:beta-lactamase n=1 Tax=Devosia ureilytica TaxID=2952754 RepID=A0A9Q4AQ58_9HYPH|nr:serine hydrolase [Devosia ureilytica]MCP8884697.1 serine hydrolase [Devosia ureilytica]MCP8888328.1 serine hydrolase [Devosia ureilytica]
MHDLTNALRHIRESVPDTVRYSILDKRHNRVVERDSEAEASSASTRKISIMLAALRAVYDGRLDLDAPILYEPRLREEVATPDDRPLDEVTTTTAADQTRLLDKLLAGQREPEPARELGLTQDLCDFALNTLGRQILRYGIPSRLPYDTKFACKGGRGKRGRMDAGIVFKDGSPIYVLGVYTDSVPLALADGTPGYTSALDTIGRVSRACWDALQ